MSANIAGVFRNGRVELMEPPQNIKEETPVIVTLLNGNEVDLRSHSFDDE